MSLKVRDLRARYDEAQVLHGINLDIGPGEVVTLLGRNGVGKTTTLRALMGLIRHRTGSVLFGDRELIKLDPERIARAGLAYCPEERGIFCRLTVHENLLLPPVLRPGGMSVEELYAMFPNLANRSATAGTKLSGGEQQMLAIARILRTGSTFLLLDEPTEGLAPVVVQQIGGLIRLLKSKGYTILLVEQNVRFAETVADRHYVIEHGKVVDMVQGGEFAARKASLQAYLGV
ncbi:ABC transporter ATP-binding protein [Paraburkholderia sp. J12]|uniref:ABC transporter ATP-binding protein n=1 Tax=Paraburkholderia sp. J12 TaxID=2805432 RepID=UPI002ABD78C8|nr:ABC transporter ATP-binding protein [Paraburkholderia sp. J12]